MTGSDKALPTCARAADARSLGKDIGFVWCTRPDLRNEIERQIIDPIPSSWRRLTLARVLLPAMAWAMRRKGWQLDRPAERVIVDVCARRTARMEAAVVNPRLLTEGVVCAAVVAGVCWRLLVYFEAEKNYAIAGSRWWSTER